MNVSLTPELKQFVDSEVEAGMYQTASEVVRAALRRLKEDQENRAMRTPRTLAALEKELLESVERLDKGEGVEGEAVLARLRKHMAAATTSGE
jgi:antitoxin ParD1/3/4